LFFFSGVFTFHMGCKSQVVCAFAARWHGFFLCPPFALHPVHCEAVFSAAGLAELLSALSLSLLLSFTSFAHCTLVLSIDPPPAARIRPLLWFSLVHQLCTLVSILSIDSPPLLGYGRCFGSHCTCTWHLPLPHCFPKRGGDTVIDICAAFALLAERSDQLVHLVTFSSSAARRSRYYSRP
jgi:hypothetical protein